MFASISFCMLWFILAYHRRQVRPQTAVGFSRLHQGALSGCLNAVKPLWFASACRGRLTQSRRYEPFALEAIDSCVDRAQTERLTKPSFNLICDGYGIAPSVQVNDCYQHSPLQLAQSVPEHRRLQFLLCMDYREQRSRTQVPELSSPYGNLWQRLGAVGAGDRGEGVVELLPGPKTAMVVAALQDKQIACLLQRVVDVPHELPARAGGRSPARGRDSPWLPGHRRPRAPPRRRCCGGQGRSRMRAPSPIPTTCA